MKRILRTDRIVSLLLAVLMALSVTVSASAAEARTYAATGVDAVLDIDPIEVRSSNAGTWQTADLVAWNFRLHGWSGVGLDGSQFDLEGYYGAEILCKNSVVTYRAYANLDGVTPKSAAAVEIASGKTVPVAIGLGNKSFNVRNLADGLYALDVAFSTGHTSRSWFYVLSKKAYAVEVDAGSLATREFARSGLFTKTKYTHYDNPADVDKLLQDWIAGQGVTPENSLGLDDITYQYWDDGAKGRSDTPRWAGLAHEIVPDEYESLPDSVKVLLLHDWITANLSYDKYLTTVLTDNAKKDKTSCSQSRAFYYKDNSGKYSVWDTRTGVCIDFSNIMTIMCRELGIPCNVMNNSTHAWNLIWLDGRWRVFDLTGDVQRKVYGLDTTEITNADLTVCYKSFDATAKSRFANVYSVGTSHTSLDDKSVEKHKISINTYCLYTRESIVKYLSVPNAAK